MIKMSYISYINRFFLLLLFSFGGVCAAETQSDDDVFTPIAKYIGEGDFSKLSVWFADNLEIDMMGDIAECSRSQAERIFEEFFERYKPHSFEVLHKSGRSPLKYAIGELSASGEKFRLSIFVKLSESGNYIQQMRIEKP